MAERRFPEIRRNLGFGMMRLPMKDGRIDNECVCRMVDRFIEGGFNYFDTAHGYHNGLSEIAVRECLTSRHDRSEYILTDKLTDEYFKTQEDIRPLLMSQLEACGVDHFDFYLMHAQNAVNYEFFKKCRAYETALGFREEGLIRHFGISFHDKADVLDRILTEYPQIEAVQIQFNYMDYEDPAIESRKVYEVCRKHDKPVIVMEPVKGGNLVKMPEAAQEILDYLRAATDSSCSNAGYAVRFAAGFDGMEMVLSGMSDMDQLEDNMSIMTDPEPMSRAETDAVMKVADVFRSLGSIPCTSCRYCIEENQCPMDIRIPNIFSFLNKWIMFADSSQQRWYNEIAEEHNSRASDCIGCGMCESVCPQHLPIRELLEKASAEFDN